ncbi:MAG: hypothetical protein KDD00_09545 [Ignavibacteriae bacterium]|nr:hypothetical protein [Ignavibacteriota bacterium]
MKRRILSCTCVILIYVLTIFSSEVYSTTHTVSVMNFAFTPSNLSVTVGDTIKWQYVSGFHTTTNDGSAGTSRPSGAPSWNNQINSSNTQYRYVITVPGSYTYICLFHPSMVGNFTAVSPPFNLNLVALMEGFWDGATLIGDTVKVSLHNSVSPYNIIASEMVKLSSAGTALVFTNVPGGNYYISVRHRNSIQTWSKDPVTLTSNMTTTYNFTTSLNKAYGNNMILKEGKYTFYSGDVNQDESINLTDVLQIYNDATVFAAGYFVTDVNGDNISDLTDVLIAQNNANNFVSVLKPAI